MADALAFTGGDWRACVLLGCGSGGALSCLIFGVGYQELKASQVKVSKKETYPVMAETQMPADETEVKPATESHPVYKPVILPTSTGEPMTLSAGEMKLIKQAYNQEWERVAKQKGELMRFRRGNETGYVNLNGNRYKVVLSALLDNGFVRSAEAGEGKGYIWTMTGEHWIEGVV